MSDKIIKYMAGDLVIQASPSEKPKSMDKSRRGYLASSRDKIIDSKPNKETDIIIWLNKRANKGRIAYKLDCLS